MSEYINNLTANMTKQDQLNLYLSGTKGEERFQKGLPSIINDGVSAVRELASDCDMYSVFGTDLYKAVQHAQETRDFSEVHKCYEYPSK